MSSKTKIEDALGEASSFATAVHLASSAMESYAKPAHVCALLLLADQVSDRLERARSLLDDLPDCPVDNGDSGENTK